ncbi:integrase core domain-containing protein [Streptomyces sp. NPDC056121]|uniref:integrase core domain-containing protein n=1 Tax=unclassified Streptomyces TaxID=2593676 RepID=UPI0035DD07B8
MNAHCERGIGSIPRETIDPVLIIDEAHPRQILAACERHYNKRRPHRAPQPATARRRPTAHRRTRTQRPCAFRLR